ncbi:hypothetical protein Poli38472_010332 [Pythium oligandrum]|uniref:Glutathione peroxidase n=1 Tax=Pythium oligandrum TaxID=41045 RepID=A0A8K1C2V0_PYTOL|nr:hypothetical protein Poli38472_010332 [Pythium oligandrum]|eukprot:TMW55450.1 hypothetical protein Poli38472_010332 [Pythium oligandrum]
MVTALDGRVFARLREFPSLSPDLQAEAKACEAYLASRKSEVFGSHHTMLVKKVVSARGKHLLEHVEAWLKEKEDETDKPLVPPTGGTTGEVKHEEKKNDESRQKHAKELIEAMVLDGFITPHKDQEKTAVATNTPKKYYRDNELFVPVAMEVANPQTTSVWTVVDGTIFAANVKRKAGLLSPLTQGKDAYIVVNEKLKSVLLFESDVGRTPLAQFDGQAGTLVSFDHSHFVHGVKVWNEQQSELLNTENKLEQEALMSALINIGAQYHEDQTFDLGNIKSLYELKELDMEGNEVCMSKYKGKVVLAVNVSSNCGFTATNYPELVELDNKYRDRGLVVLGFPCNQFGGQEPGTHDEIKEFVKQYNCEFELFAKRDVNGAHTRPVFTFLKTKLPGSFGNYIKWNFTKFLVDRNGQPVKRYAPNERPLSFEDDIIALLDKDTELAMEDLEVEEKPAAVHDAVSDAALEDVSTEFKPENEIKIHDTGSNATLEDDSTEAKPETEFNPENEIKIHENGSNAALEEASTEFKPENEIKIMSDDVSNMQDDKKPPTDVPGAKPTTLAKVMELQEQPSNQDTSDVVAP